MFIYFLTLRAVLEISSNLDNVELTYVDYMHFVHTYNTELGKNHRYLKTEERKFFNQF